jgi:hypothetical protein
MGLCFTKGAIGARKFFNVHTCLRAYSHNGVSCLCLCGEFQPAAEKSKSIFTVFGAEQMPSNHAYSETQN